MSAWNSSGQAVNGKIGCTDVEIWTFQTRGEMKRKLEKRSFFENPTPILLHVKPCGGLGMFIVLKSTSYFIPSLFLFRSDLI
ncbi:hypothetical protein RRG08_045307 [Elysia crispata]|uniref:Uncharacterized protein n=1 Tax=Elysia crispata TaxID=231223 RepID=A0AAE1A3F5_9GAST|nr:hypothetical protein RRG08_045307 [Elysia crispata]